MAVNTDLEAPPIIDYGQPTPETGRATTAAPMSPEPTPLAPPPPPTMTASAALPKTNVAGTFTPPAGAIAPEVYNALKAQGIDLDAAMAAYQATPEYKALAQAQSDKDARIAAYKAANPGASDFQAQYYSMTPEEQAQMQTNYGAPAAGKLHKSMYYSGVAPTQGQTMLDYMLANNGKTPETKVKEGPGLGQALLTAAMLAAGGYGFGTLMNGLMAGGLAGGGTALSGSSGLNTLLGGAGADVLAPTISELVITGGAGNALSPAVAAALGLGGTAAGTILSGASGSNTLGGDLGTDTLQPQTQGTQGADQWGYDPKTGDLLSPEIVGGPTSLSGGGLNPALVAGGMTGTLLGAQGGTYTTPGSQGSGTPDDYTLPEETLVPTTPGNPPLIPPFVLSPFTPVQPVPPTINPNQPGLKPMPDFKPTMPTSKTDVPDVSQPDKPTQPTGDTGGTGGTTTTTTTGRPTAPGTSGRTTPTLKSFNPNITSEPFNLQQFLSSMTSPRAGVANLGNVSPFSGGGVGPGAGPLDLKGSSAPDIYPWVQESGG